MMNKLSMKLVFLVVLLIFVAGETSNIGAEGRVNQVHCFGYCEPGCCDPLGYCLCGPPLTSQPHHGPEEPPMAMPIPPMAMPIPPMPSQ
ncbi:hypothetical protein LINGRAHAP2_LOCUS33847 [Linum grandiflorum]